ncbi:unnamed protein product, partial [Rotaria socialis]
EAFVTLTSEIQAKSPSISFINSNKGKPLLVADDYTFKLNKTTTSTKYWICTINGCAAKVHTDLNNGLMKTVGNHSHLPEKENLSLISYKKYTSYYLQLAKILTDNVSCQKYFFDIFPFDQGTAKNRRKMIPTLPESCLFDIHNEFKLTIEKKRFLLIDEARVRRERLLLFASDAQLDLLFNASTIYMDGTLKKTPPQFSQIYIIHIVHFDICVPCVFGFLVNKKAATYKQIFSELKIAALRQKTVFSPSVIMTDFESGSISAVKDEFPTAQHLGCYFHFSQAIFRHIQFLGLQRQYTIDETLRVLCRKLMALPLMPRDKILSGLDEIREAADLLPGLPMIRLLEYFDKNCMLDIDLWNVYGFDSRTNNICEGDDICLMKMNSRIYRNHPNIWHLIDFMKGEEKNVQNIVLQWSSGASKKKTKRTTALQNRINTLYSRYNN